MANNEARRRTAATPARGTSGILAVVALIVAALSSTGTESASAADVAEALHFCSSCHGPDGRSTSSRFPRLAGQHKDYIVAQLRDFRNDTRTAPHTQTYLDYLAMWGLVAHLSDPSIDAIAAFYASQAPVAGEPAASAEIAAGEKIYTDGVPSERVPACISCHGAKAEGNGSIPRLAGQYQEYLARQLEAFASWARQNVMMHTNSVNLTPEQVGEVTAYLATL